MVSQHDSQPGGGRGPLLAAAAIALVAAAAAITLVARRQGPPPAPSRAPAPPARPTAVPPAPPAEAPPPTLRPAAPERPTRQATVLRVDADVRGASVFLDHKYLGTTPLETRDFEPGSHRLNVTAEGYEMYGEPVELRDGPNAVSVRFKQVRLDEQVEVVHKHGVGSCHGVLHATTAGLRFEASKPADSFEAGFSTLEPLVVDYLARNLRVKQKGGRTWNFTSQSADTLLAFQQRVEAARARL